MVYLLDSGLVNIAPQRNGLLESLVETFQLNETPDNSLINLAITGIFIANTLPAMLLGTIAGVWADRLPKRRVMVASNGLRALLVMMTPFCVLKGPSWVGLGWGYWALLIMTFIESILTQFFAPAEQASIPMLVPKKDLMPANSIYQATSMGATIIGFALGFPILTFLKTNFPSIGLLRGEFLLLPFCYGIAAIIISKIYIKEEQTSTPQESVWMEIKEGLDVLKEKQTVRTAMMQLVLLYSLLAALYVLSLNLAAAIEEVGRTGFGTLLSMSGLGMAIGAVGIAQFGQSFIRRQLSAAGLGTITWSLILLGQSKGSLWITLITCGILGIGASLVAIPAQTTLQEDTPESKRGKVFGLQNNLINIALSLPLVLAGALVSQFGILPVLWALATLAFLSAILVRPWQRC